VVPAIAGEKGGSRSHPVRDQVLTGSPAAVRGDSSPCGPRLDDRIPRYGRPERRASGLSLNLALARIRSTALSMADGGISPQNR